MTYTCSESAGDRSPLMVRLLEPADTVPLSALPAGWFHQRVEVLVADRAAAAADPALTGRLRGAWGRALMRGASDPALAGRPCRWEPPCAFDPLFREQGRITTRLSIPRPYVLAARPMGGDLLVVLTVFGFACDWIEAAADALVAGLRHGEPAPLGGPATLLGRRLVTADTVTVPAAETGPALLTFHTPVAFRDGNDLRFPGLRTLVSSLGNRVSGLARWQDTAVATDWKTIAEHAETLTLEGDLTERRWQRRSNRQDGRAIPLGGWLGRLVIGGDLAPILPLLALGTTCHAGSHTTLGLGACTLTMAAG